MAGIRLLGTSCTNYSLTADQIQSLNQFAEKGSICFLFAVVSISGACSVFFLYILMDNRTSYIVSNFVPGKGFFSHLPVINQSTRYVSTKAVGYCCTPVVPVLHYLWSAGFIIFCRTEFIYWSFDVINWLIVQENIEPNLPEITYFGSDFLDFTPPFATPSKKLPLVGK